MDNILLDLKQAAATLAVDESTLLRWVRDGVCPPPMLVSGLPRWAPETLQRWAIGGCVAGQPLHHRVNLQIRKGHLEDVFRTGDALLNEIELENDEL